MLDHLDLESKNKIFELECKIGHLRDEGLVSNYSEIRELEKKVGFLMGFSSGVKP